MDDVTIPAETAKRVAAYLRGDVVRTDDWPALADLLDPPAVSLRDELAALMPDVYRDYGATKIVYDKTVDAIRAAVRKHVEALPVGVDGAPDYRQKVLRLLGDDDDQFRRPGGALAEAFPAGEFLAGELKARGWTQAEFAAILDRPAQFVSEIISGEKQITRESAAQIGAALGTSAEMWLSLQDKHFVWKQDQDTKAQRDLDDIRRRAAQVPDMSGGDPLLAEVMEVMSGHGWTCMGPTCGEGDGEPCGNREKAWAITARDMLNVVRKHVEEVGGTRVMVVVPDSRTDLYVYREDVLALFGGTA